MNVRRIVTFVCACALSAVAGHWHARSGLETAPMPGVSELGSELAPTRAQLLLPAEEGRCTAAAVEHSDRALESAPPSVAFEEALKQHDPELRLAGLRSAFARLVSVDLTQALQRTERIPADERDAIVAPVLSTWSRSNPRDAWHALDRIDLSREDRLAVFAGIAERDPSAAANWLRTSIASRQDASPPIELYRAVVPAVARNDVSEAAALIAELGSDAPLDLIQQVAVAQAKLDPLDGLAWASNLDRSTEYERIRTLQAASASVVAMDPDAAAAVLDRTADAQIRRHLMREIAAYKAQRSVRDAWEWLGTYRGDDAYRESVRALLSAWSYAKPAEVAAVVLDIDDVEFQRGAAEQLSNVWQERDPRALREWVATLPNGKLRDALRPIIREASDTQGARAWDRS